ncbi:MAG: hypothetical protein R3266_08635, partial [Gemmatimonadota bacterium]|nr:hypothetical protein [Gemmatimonadota bacterium]
MRHLTTDEMERFADARLGPDPGPDRVAHLASCPACREEVELLRGLVRRISGMARTEPRRGFADAVMRRVDLPIPWLDRQLGRLRHLSPAPGFAAAVLARVTLPLPWHER